MASRAFMKRVASPSAQASACRGSCKFATLASPPPVMLIASHPLPRKLRQLRPAAATAEAPVAAVLAGLSPLTRGAYCPTHDSGAAINVDGPYLRVHVASP